MKKQTVFFVLLAVISLLPLRGLAANEGTGAHWELTSSAGEYLVDDTVYIELCASDAEDLFAYEGEILFDPDYLSFQEAVFEGAGYSKVQQSEEGIVQFVYTEIGENRIMDADKLVAFQFQARKTGKTAVKLIYASAVDTALHSDPNNAPNAVETVEITEPEPPKRPNNGGGGGGGGGGLIVSSPKPTASPTPTTEPEPTPAPDDLPAEEPSGALPPNFSDMAGFEWAEEAVNALAAQNILNGVGESLFAPADEMTRAEAAKLLTAAFSGMEPDAAEEAPFPDVPNGEWYAGYVSYAVRQGWITGYEDGTLHEEDPLTRAQIAAIIFRLLTDETIEQYGGNAPVFEDVSTDAWYYRYVSTIASAGIVAGIHQLAGKPLLHGLLAALAGKLDHPADGERLPALGTDLHGDLIGRTAHSSRFDFEEGHSVLQSLGENVDRLRSEFL